MKLKLKKLHISGRALALFWFRHARVFFAFLFFFAIGAGMYFWYDNVYRGDWTDEERRLYAESAFQETLFQESDFRKAVETADRRSRLHAEDFKVGNDFFVPIPGMEKK